MMLAVAVSAALLALVLWVFDWRVPPASFPAPASVYNAALRTFPDMIVTSARSVTVNRARAWEVRGALNGIECRIVVLDTGEVVSWDAAPEPPVSEYSPRLPHRW
jgi:hypothetical protein